MKKILSIVAFVAALVWATPAQAQFKFGVVGGLNLSSLSFDGGAKNLDSDNRCGWYIGPKVRFTLPIVGLGVDASVQYMNRRMNFSSDELDRSDSKTLQTIEIPINVRYNIGLSSLASIYLSTGPQFGFNIGHKIGDYIKLKDANTTWNVGAGVHLLGHLEVGVGYNIALSKFGDFGGSEANNIDGDFKTNTWQVQLAYYF